MMIDNYVLRIWKKKLTFIYFSLSNYFGLHKLSISLHRKNVLRKLLFLSDCKNISNMLQESRNPDHECMPYGMILKHLSSIFFCTNNFFKSILKFRFLFCRKLCGWRWIFYWSSLTLATTQKHEVIILVYQTFTILLYA